MGSSPHVRFLPDIDHWAVMRGGPVRAKEPEVRRNIRSSRRPARGASTALCIACTYGHRNLMSLSRRQLQQLLFRSVVYLYLEQRKLGFEIPRPFLRRFKRWKYRLHPAIDSHANALGHHKVSACDVAGMRLVRYRQRLFHGNSLDCPLPI
jgi:hypothetical protein